MNANLVNHGKNSKHFDLNHGPSFMYFVTNFTNINRIIITFAVSGFICMVRILKRSNSLNDFLCKMSYRLTSQVCGIAP